MIQHKNAEISNNKLIWPTGKNKITDLNQTIYQ